MTDQIVVQPQPRAWLERSVLQPYVSEYARLLHQGRYAPSTRRVYLCCVAHFAHWLTREGYRLGAINGAAVARFTSEHLPACACPAPVRRSVHEVRAALAHLLEALRAAGVIAGAGAAEDDRACELARFNAHMRDAGGLAAATRRQRCRIIERFLIERFGGRTIIISALTAAAVRRFILDDERRRSAGTIRVMGGAIGCYLRFRSLSGDRVKELLAAIPHAAHWRLAPLPEVLSDAELDQLLRSFDRPFPSRQRAYAIVRCLTDLGLRSSEVAGLKLEDIDWREGTIRLTGTKTRRADLLPLPAATGRAIAGYLRDERPTTTNRAIFVRHVAPYDVPIDKGVVRRAVLAAYRRCGWSRSRVHILRHSVASRLLRAGAPMKEVADLLRHRSLDTSAIYAKVDLYRLAAVASPWPGSAP